MSENAANEYTVNFLSVLRPSASTIEEIAPIYNELARYARKSKVRPPDDTVHLPVFRFAHAQSRLR